jgi:hypothetical protein
MHAHASARSPSATTFYANRLSLVEQMEMNGLNNEIMATGEFTAPVRKRSVNQFLTSTPSRAMGKSLNAAHVGAHRRKGQFRPP